MSWYWPFKKKALETCFRCGCDLPWYCHGVCTQCQIDLDSGAAEAKKLQQLELMKQAVREVLREKPKP